MNTDLGLTDIYTSWFGLPVDGMGTEEIQEMVFLHFRGSYLAGRIQGQADIVPLVHEHAEKMRRLTRGMNT